MTLCFATNNAHKLEEVASLLKGSVPGRSFELLTLDQIGCHEELPETGATLEANSLQKAEYLLEHYHRNCFADDTGLEVAALDGEPGVYSARYAGPQRVPAQNVQLLLQKLENKFDRSARFRTVFTLILNGELHQFEGVVDGHIMDRPRGGEGFGYDPVFVPNGQHRTFAEMTLEEKNKLSHRARALEKLVEFLKVYSS